MGSEKGRTRSNTAEIIDYHQGRVNEILEGKESEIKELLKSLVEVTELLRKHLGSGGGSESRVLNDALYLIEKRRYRDE